MRLILFVCTGNVCRSPMAAGLLRQRLTKDGLGTRYEVRSAGVQALEGSRASRNAIIVMAQRWVDITDHVGHTITADDVEKASLILVMTGDQQKVIQQTWPQYAWKVHRLSEMSGKRQDVQDPYRGSLKKYEAAADVITRYIDQGLDRILELA